MQAEVDIQCPFCGEPITVFVDPSVEDQTYVEDCTVCCRPIQLSVKCEEENVTSVEVQRS